MPVLKAALSIFITWCVVYNEMPAISAEVQTPDISSSIWETKFNSLQSSQMLLQTIVSTAMRDLANEKENRGDLERILARETEQRRLLKDRLQVLQDSLSKGAQQRRFRLLQKGLSKEREQRTLLEDRIQSLQNGLSKEREQRMLLNDRLQILQNGLSKETEQRALLEKLLETQALSETRLQALQTGITYEKQRRVLLEDQLEDLKRAFKGQNDKLHKWVMNISVVQSQEIKVHGNWSMWSAWSACTQLCGDGQRNRFRTCTKPPPSNGGRVCVGHSEDTDPCANPECEGLYYVRLIIRDGHIRTVSQMAGLLGVAVNHKSGMVYITEYNNHRVSVYNENGTLIKRFGSRAQFFHPAGVAVNSRDEVIIADFLNHRIVVCNRDGEFR